MARQFVINSLNSIPENSMIAFTDGSAIPNPGPCGASAVIFSNGLNSQPIILSKSISKYSSSYHGELEAINLAVNFAKNYSETHYINQLRIYSDCQSALLAVSNIEPSINFRKSILEIRSKIGILQSQNTQVIGIWVCGHANIMGNELADENAKKAALEAKTLTTKCESSIMETKNAIKKLTVNRWQKAWNSIPQGRDFFLLCPTVSRNCYKSIGNIHGEIKLNRIKFNNTRLKQHLYNKALCDSPECDCEQDRETPEHILLHCNLYNLEREHLLDCIEHSFVKNNVPFHLRHIDFNTLVSGDSMLDKNTNTEITMAVTSFLSRIPAKI